MSTFGIMLLLVGAALAVAEAHVPTHGALGSASVAAIVAGVVMVVAGTGVGLALALAVGLAAGAVGAGYLWIVLRKAMAARGMVVRSGAQGLVGRVGEVRAVPAPLGKVFLDGAIWRARMWAGDEEAEVRRGDPIVVERVDGLTLTVRCAEEWEVAP
ncbi:MAG TPA: NfeD family protein [Solirubrobacteraceae bacterium]|nr:NfeD family protein [Solirubrobacteraceae bacterium]